VSPGDDRSIPERLRLKAQVDAVLAGWNVETAEIVVSPVEFCGCASTRAFPPRVVHFAQHKIAVPFSGCRKVMALLE